MLVHFREQYNVDYLATYSYDWDHQKWLGPYTVTSAGATVTGVVGRPAYVEQLDGPFYSAVVQLGDHIALYSRNATNPNTWNHKCDIPVQADPASGVISLASDSISLFQSPIKVAFGQGATPLRLLVHFNETAFEGGRYGTRHTFDYLTTYVTDWDMLAWFNDPPVAVGGNVVNGVASF